MPDVELRRRRDIAAHCERAAHQHEALEPARPFGIAGERERDVGEGTGRDDDELAFVRARRRKQGVDGVRRIGRRRRLRQHGAAEAAGAVDVAGVADMAEQRGRGPRPDRDVAAPRQRQHGAGVALGLGQADVAGDRADADEPHVRAAKRVEQREGVVDAGVDVEDQRDHAVSVRQKPARSLARHRTNIMSATAVNPTARPIHSPRPPSGVRKPSASPTGAPITQ